MFFMYLLFNVTIPKKFGSAMKILVKIKVYLSTHEAEGKGPMALHLCGISILA